MAFVIVDMACQRSTAPYVFVSAIVLFSSVFVLPYKCTPEFTQGRKKYMYNSTYNSYMNKIKFKIVITNEMPKNVAHRAKWTYIIILIAILISR